MNNKKMSVITLSVTLGALLIVASVTAIFDPYFHYHEPFAEQRYSLHNQRYQNNGIARHFEYNAIITGTSMTENFKTTEFDELFDVNSIKIPYFGASFKEIDEAVSDAIAYNGNVSVVLRSLDHYKLFDDKDFMGYSDYPEYLYDENVFNDVKYLLNKDILLGDTYQTVMMTLKKSPSTTFDDYSNWNNHSKFGKDVVMSTYERKETVGNKKSLSEEDKKNIKETVLQNFIRTAQENPSTDFYIFLPPYSMVYWDSLYMDGEIERHLEAQKIAIEMMLECSNIHVFSFSTDYETICNLDNYKDITHYKEEINSKILLNMKNEKYKITKSNSSDYFSEVYNYYTTYNYDSLFS